MSPPSSCAAVPPPGAVSGTEAFGKHRGAAPTAARSTQPLCKPPTRCALRGMGAGSSGLSSSPPFMPPPPMDLLLTMAQPTGQGPGPWGRRTRGWSGAGASSSASCSATGFPGTLGQAGAHACFENHVGGAPSRVPCRAFARASPALLSPVPPGSEEALLLPEESLVFASPLRQASPRGQ